MFGARVNYIGPLNELSDTKDPRLKRALDSSATLPALPMDARLGQRACGVEAATPFLGGEENSIAAVTHGNGN
jgi:hypothetical protein